MQKGNGVVRRVDELGRVVIPREIRYTHDIQTGSEIEFFCDNDHIILSKYEPISQKSDFANKCVAVLGAFEDAGFLLCDRQGVVFTKNLPHKDYQSIKIVNNKLDIETVTQLTECQNVEVVPIRALGEDYGSIIVVSSQPISGVVLSNANTVAKIIANYLSK